MVLLPIILLFIIIGIVILNSGSARLFEGFKEGLEGGENCDAVKKRYPGCFPEEGEPEPVVILPRARELLDRLERGEQVAVETGGASDVEQPDNSVSK